ncbi:unnamed protein product [Urochloa decumbens]|uniref:F-box domain-containing protein n=1 Tax=Urochloa decumbens TaxID=240449 RepID=A0ABC9GC18_9POAL
MAPPPALVDDLIGEILLRLPTDDPACLFRAALVCKPWRCLLSDDAFLRRYRAFHRTPPVLGFFHDGDVIGKSLLAGDALYFTIEEGRRILKYEYDMVEQELSVIKAPPVIAGNMALVTAEGSGLGAAGVKGYSLHLWSWQIGADSIGEWVPDRVIELGKMISIGIGDPTTKLNVIGFAEGAGSIFINANDSIFIVEVKSGTVRKTIGKRGDFSSIFPFVSFYTPDHDSTTLQVSMSME